MGFGILFIGYFFAYIGAISPLSVFTYVIGMGIIIYSLKNLVYENKMFVATMIASVLMEAVSIAKMMMYVFGFVNNTAYNVINHIQGYLAPLISVLLVIAIYIIAKQVGLVKVQTKSVVDLILLGIYVVSAVLFNLINNEFAKQRLFAVNVVSLFICTVFTLVIVFNCYVRICYEGDENMDGDSEIKPIAFLNRALDKVINKNKTGKKK